MIKKIIIIITGLFVSTNIFANVVQVTREKPSFTITLSSNPTTGYLWFLAGYNAKLIKPVSQKYGVDEIAQKNGLMGAPGKSVWTFKALPAAFVVRQVTHLKFIYMRSWETLPKKPDYTVYTVVISGN